MCKMQHVMTNKLTFAETVDILGVILKVHQIHEVCTKVPNLKLPQIPPVVVQPFGTANEQECTAARRPKIAATQVLHESDRGVRLKLMAKLGSHGYVKRRAISQLLTLQAYFSYKTIKMCCMLMLGL